MDVALQCAQCGTPSAGNRFCVTCGGPLPSPATAVPGPPPPPGPHLPVAAPWGPPPVPTQWTGPQAPPPWAPPPVAFPPAGYPAAGFPPAPQSRQPLTGRRIWANALAILVVGALGFSGWALMHGAERHTLSGTVSVVDSSYDGLSPQAGCSGSGGYGDINAGAQVVLSDGNGSTLATTRLSDGEFDGQGCVFSFALHDVPHASAYALAIAGENRGQLQYSYAELTSDNWSLQLGLGND